MPGLTADNVPARLFYYAPPSDGSKPHIYISPPEGVLPINYGTDEHVAQIENVRGKEGTFTLDNAGFLFGKQAPNHKSFSNDEEIEKEYYPESIDLIKHFTGASKVVLFDHTVRRRIAGETGMDPKRRGPVPRTHVDQTPSAAHNRVRRHLPETEAKERLKHRFQIINLWRPISHPADDWPLAVCDFRSVNWDRDLVPVDLVYPDRVGETFSVKYNPEHKWKYLRGMTPEEFILIKCYDSVEDGSVAVLTPHTAFEDPATAADSPPRQSIELRALVFYD